MKKTCTMAWERRNNRLFFYRSRYVNGRTVKEYVGCGPEAERVAREDAEERAQREADLQERRQRRQEYGAVQLALKALTNECQTLMRASLLSAGYHQHARGKWRKRREYRRAEERAE